jgi:uncharacterized protein YkwD
MSDALVLLNATRAMHDKRRLKRGKLLEIYANHHARKMAKMHTLEHGDLQGYLISKHAYSFWGENVGCASSEGDPILALHKAYLASPSHRANMLNGRFRRAGMGVYRANGVTWSCQAFRV